MLWLTVLLIGIPCLLLWDYLIRKRRNDMLNYMRGPLTLPFLGSVHLHRGLDGERVMDYALANCAKYGKMYRIWILNQLTIFCTDPRDIEIILSSTQHIKKNSLYNLMLPWLGTGLLMSVGRKWHARRKIITPTFHFKILEQFVDIFDLQSNILVDQLQKHADGKTAFNIFPIICLTALDIIAETAMGTKVNAQRSPDLPYVRAVFEVTNIITLRFIKPWQRIDWMFRLVEPSLAKRQDTLIKTMHDFTETVIQQRRDALINHHQQQQKTKTKTNCGGNECDDLGQKRRMALLDVLLQSTIDGEPLSNEDIREEVDTFMFEGHDTTTSGISFCLYEISRHASVQQRLVNEIHEVLGDDKKRPVTLRDLNELKYLECVIKESLRMHPPVPIIGRNLTEDVDMRGQLIPAGTNFIIGLYAVLRSPREFEAPNEFRPERFASDEATISSPASSQSRPTQPQMQFQTHPYAYVPFSAGPRNCIGQKYAILEMKSVISKVLQHFELLPLGPEPRPMLSLVLRSANGIHLGMRPRQDP
ncbi:cytochrome P450 4d2 [Drosophila innubila]|uniref:cytochrome P450 4d2 n=1 Tax=Drosophila innubila TaxID=198719 RepID=UPI00148C3E2C|nr:cytochrome P450 4d2 [Drosophila innubila]XP_034477500.1 cytochrome P450 4d2 [Drosophila innubila]